MCEYESSYSYLFNFLPALDYILHALMMMIHITQQLLMKLYKLLSITCFLLIKEREVNILSYLTNYHFSYSC